jgi:antibiotic biosynthesis monooxygenase (ABM) superfamily enzyme
MRQKIIQSAIIWTGLYPILLLVSTILHPFIGDWHFALKTLVTTLIVVPIMVFFIIPFVRYIFQLLRIVK